MDISKLTPQQQAQLVEARWASSDSVWDVVKKVYDRNIKIYKNEPEWAAPNIASQKKGKVRANRIFRNTESVINALIANPPRPNMLPNRNTAEAKALAAREEKFFGRKYIELNIKEQMRKGLRNLYFARLIVLKPFWNKVKNDIDAIALDPKKVRVNKQSTNEDNSDFAIEEIDCPLSVMLDTFPEKEADILRKAGYNSKEEAFIANPNVTYKEAWIGNHVLFKYSDIMLAVIRNPYWDWDGLLVTQDEELQLKGTEQAEPVIGPQRANLLNTIRSAQAMRRPAAPNPGTSDTGTTGVPGPAATQAQLHAYYFNHFDHPRKPYIFATILNNENSPIGQTDFITQAAPLQEGIDRRKQDIDENASLVNGTIKVDSSVMSKAEAQKLRFEARGVIWGKGVVAGVERETGTPLPNFVYEDMVDSRQEIDNIMAANANFRGEREGQETKGRALALIDQNYMNLNELTQVVDYVNGELFNWFYQLAKMRYTEHHYAKTMGRDAAIEVVSMHQDDFLDGTEVRVISGKSLPEDKVFRYTQAQEDVAAGILSPVDYLEVAGYEEPMQKAKNRVMYNINPLAAVGVTPEEAAAIAPPQAPAEKPPSMSMPFGELPPDGQIQMAAKAGIQLDPALLLAEKQREQRLEQEKQAADIKAKERGPIKSPIQPRR